MKVLVIVFDGTSPELLLSGEQQPNLTRLMELGCFGALTPEDENHSLLLEGLLRTACARHKKRYFLASGPLFSLLSHTPNGNVEELEEGLIALNRSNFETVRDQMAHQDWDYFEFVERTPLQVQPAVDSFLQQPKEDNFPIYYAHLDDEIGWVLEELDEHTAVFILATRAQPDYLEHPQDGQTIWQGGFILAFEHNPLFGEIQGASIYDLAQTLLSVGEIGIPPLILGRSLLEGYDLSQPDEGQLSLDEESILRDRLSGLGYIE